MFESCRRCGGQVFKDYEEKGFCLQCGYVKYKGRITKKIRMEDHSDAYIGVRFPKRKVRV